MESASDPARAGAPRHAQPNCAKIVCTLGPATQDASIIARLIESGMDVARLNFSHGTHADHQRLIHAAREASHRTGQPIALLQDLSGPKLRLGEVPAAAATLVTGSDVSIGSGSGFDGVPHLPCAYEALARDVCAGNALLLDDGKVRLRVKEVRGDDVLCIVEHGGEIRSRVGMHLPGVRVSAPALSAKDIDDLAFGLAAGVDLVALSFVRSAEDLHDLRRRIQRESGGRFVAIVSKIEKPEAIDALDAIVGASDAVMVARGDLGVEMPPEDVPMLQKQIVRTCNRMGKPVIVATQMLESMTTSPRPTRAEASDVANAVLDGADAVMLSGETSIGQFPVEVVKAMDAIVRSAERGRSDRLDSFQLEPAAVGRDADAMARTACMLARETQPAAIVAVTDGGRTALRLARWRPLSAIIACTANESTVRQLSLAWGVRGLLVPREASMGHSSTQEICASLVQRGMVRRGDLVLLLEGQSGSSQGAPVLRAVRVDGNSSSDR
ncbi:MAG: pyruvate kinase [Planctomycetota bacterium]